VGFGSSLMPSGLMSFRDEFARTANAGKLVSEKTYLREPTFRNLPSRQLGEYR
jgi:hypothetical protein